ncbi:hypothetical protein BO70DRAFT_357819 [Aspergillus heteromorphus CBS 117.55]|uniref:tRNA (guanine(9)-N1)-methyltransferase n=1 Tax=Aspergillus heteromorphus CBS 117.55 TaxID=1448321 RepID=A0A317X556_9EURO|nr:uncharacterized protein BO70DRAFT_357819 [Aspergillus heteromorphus CBS 117.55]PWY92677.1 hypothetical protein BO70DRAFT_357819 [Aspergillus heteromorphus CBS 117.55]
MEDEGRPRKLPKLDHAESQDSEPRMTGALVSEQPDTTAPETTATATATATTENGEYEIVGANAAEESNAGDEPKISKRQMKKLRRREQRRAALEQAKEDGTLAELKKSYERTPERFRKSKLLPMTLVIDCGYDELMLDKERISLGSQITRSYSDNSRSPFRSHLVVSSFNKLLKHRFDTVLAGMHQNWKGVRVLEDDFACVAEKAKEWMVVPAGGTFDGVFANMADAKPEDGEVVYLSSDSPNTLTELKPFSTYIVGGLVDKNRHKAICYKAAVEKGIKTAKLPIGDYIQMASRQVLATNHVVEIMLRWLELGDWGKAFLSVIPQRKGGTLKETTPGDSSRAESAEINETEDVVEDDAEVDDVEKEEAEAVKQAEQVTDQAMEEAPVDASEAN